MTTSSVPGYVSEIQKISFKNLGSGTITFRGRTTSPITVGSSTRKNLFDYLTFLSTLETFTMTDAAGTVVDTNSLTTIVNGDVFKITFTSLVGPLPLLTATGPIDISSVVKGEAPFRAPVSVVRCSGSPGTVYLAVGSIISPTPLTTSTSKDQVAAAAQSLGFGTVDGSSPSGGNALCNGDIFLKFKDIKGVAPTITVLTSSSDLNSLSTTVTVSNDASLGAIQGIYPIYGTFSLTYNNEITSPLLFDSSASDVEAALEKLYSVGDVSVQKDMYGTALQKDGTSSVYAYGAVDGLFKNYIFSIWTIVFNGGCVKSSRSCPVELGDVPLLGVDQSNIVTLSNYVSRQEVPEVKVRESVKGHGGNDLTLQDNKSKISVSLVHQADSSVYISTTVKEQMFCKLVDGFNSPQFSIRFLNDSTVIDATTDVRGFLASLNSLKIGGSAIKVISEDDLTQSICSSAGELTTIEFLSPRGRSLPKLNMFQTIGVLTSIKYVSTGIDSIDVGALEGLHMINYTPVVLGAYDIAVKINNATVFVNSSREAVVSPAQEYAATSTHNISQVVTQGKKEFFSVQIRDRFGNPFDRSIASTSSFVTSLIGTPDKCQNSEDPAETVIIPVSNDPQATYSDGKYHFSYEPTIAGTYKMSVKLMTRGGLLATFYKTSNFSSPVHTSTSNSYAYHDPYWCDGLESGNFSTTWTFNPQISCDKSLDGCGCDSTRLDSRMSFDWGFFSPLPNDEPYSGKFPNDFFSVDWRGYLTAPESGLYRFTIFSDYGARVFINNQKLMDSIPVTASSVSFTVTLDAGVANEILIQYVHNSDAANFEVRWSGPGIEDNSVLTGEHLSYVEIL